LVGRADVNSSIDDRRRRRDNLLALRLQLGNWQADRVIAAIRVEHFDHTVVLADVNQPIGYRGSREHSGLGANRLSPP